jgi:hypothetical protein
MKQHLDSSMNELEMRAAEDPEMFASIPNPART